jgi:toxin ParE1/3/4
MAFQVKLTRDAASDLEDLYDYVARHDSEDRAAELLEKIAATLGKSTTSPHRGAYPQELIEVGMREYREIFFKPYRVIYRVMDKVVYVYLIVDGRRDLRTLLQRRLMNG